MRRLVPRVINLPEVMAFFGERLARQVATTGDEGLAALLEELARYPSLGRSPGTSRRQPCAES